MPKRTHILGAAIGLAAAAGLLALLVLPSTTNAHTASFSATCGSVTIVWSNFPAAGPGSERNGGRNTPSWTLTFTPAAGGASTTLTNQPPVSFAGSTYPLVVPIPAENGSVTASSSWTSADTTNGVSGSTATPSPIVVANCAPPTTTTTTTTRSTTTTSSTRTSTATTGSTETSITTTTRPGTETTTSVPAATASVTTSATTTSAPGAAAVLGSQTCVEPHKTVTFSRVPRGSVIATVQGAGVKEVVLSLDGRTARTLTRPNLGHDGYRYSVTVAHTRYGTHRLTVRYVGVCAPHAYSTSFTRPAPTRVINPTFTG